MRASRAAIPAVAIAVVLGIGASAIRPMASTPSSGGPALATVTPAARPSLAGAAPLAPSVPSAKPPKQPVAAPDCRVLKCIALTFDDGPVRQTRQVLAVLREHNAHATFFVIGLMARHRTAILHQAVADGDAIGNHTWTHPQFFRISSAAIRREITRNDKLIASATGVWPVMVRPPYGEVDGRVKKVLRKLGHAIILWSVDTEDWRHENRHAKKVIHAVMSHARRNAIVLMHDIRPSTRAAVGRIVTGLQKRGYTLVTVPELFGGRLTPGKVYPR